MSTDIFKISGGSLQIYKLKRGRSLPFVTRFQNIPLQNGKQIPVMTGLRGRRFYKGEAWTNAAERSEQEES